MGNSQTPLRRLIRGAWGSAGLTAKVEFMGSGFLQGSCNSAPAVPPLPLPGPAACP